jgi:hypothetical protein
VTVLRGALAVLTAVLLGSAAVSGQGGEPVDLDTRLGDLKEFVNAKKGNRDREAIEVMDGLMRRYGDLDKKGQKRVATAVGKILTGQRAKRSPENAQLFEHGILALGQMGKLGSGLLQKAYDKKKFKGKRRKDWVGLRAGMLVALGSTKDPAAIEFLLKKANGDNYDKLKGAAGGALGEFAGVSKKQRRDICAKLIRTLVTSQSQSHNLEIGAIEREGYRRRFEATRVPWTRTLQRLTGQRETDPVKWQRMLNKKKLFRETSRRSKRRSKKG